MKKSVLTLLTTAAVVATSVGSFAAWDVLSATSTGTVKINKPVEVTAENMPAFNETYTLGQVPEYTSTAKIVAEDVPAGTEVKLELTPEVKLGGADVTSKVDVEVTQANDTLTQNGGTYTDSTVVVGTAGNEYNIKVTPKEAFKTDLQDQTLTVNLTGLLSEK